MQYRRLGGAGLMVSQLGLGTMIFGEETDRGVSPADARRLVDAFLDAGGNHFDLADVYAGGRAEEIIGEALRGKRDQAVVTTKARWPTGSGPNDAGLSRYHLFNAVEASLGRLRTETIDVFYLHGWDPWTPLEETLGALSDLVRAGKIRYVGVSNFKAWQVMKALGLSESHGWPRFVAAQYQYSLVVRDIEPEFNDLCETEGVGLVPWGPLGGGFLSGKYRADARPTEPSEGRLSTTPDAWEESWQRRATAQNWAILDRVKSIAVDHNCSPSQVALAWLLARPMVASVVIGARTLDQLEDNLGAVAVRLTDDDLAALEQVSHVPSGYPYRTLNAATR